MLPSLLVHSPLLKPCFSYSSLLTGFQSIDQYQHPNVRIKISNDNIMLSSWYPRRKGNQASWKGLILTLSSSSKCITRQHICICPVQLVNTINADTHLELHAFHCFPYASKLPKQNPSTPKNSSPCCIGLPSSGISVPLVTTTLPCIS